MPKPYYDSGEGQIFHGDSLEVLKTMPDESVQCCITSPPYWGLRDYGIDGQLGLEKTPEEYVEKIVEIFREVRRVLRSDGTLWLNLGDSYVASGSGACHDSWGGNFSQKQDTLPRETHKSRRSNTGCLKPKDLVGIPWRVALALQADGWWLRSDIIWNKPNPMPESVTDRPTKAHEYLFLLTKSARYYYDADAIREPHQTNLPVVNKSGGGRGAIGHIDEGKDEFGSIGYHSSGRNKRTVWTIPTKPFPKAHFATFPPALIEPCILAGTPEKGCCVECGSPWERVVEKESVDVTRGEQEWRKNCPDKTGRPQQDLPGGYSPKTKTIGWQPTCNCGLRISACYENTKPVPCTVLDPFGGAMTTAITAYKHGRKFVMIELSKSYIDDIGIPRIKKATQQLKLFT